MRLSYQTTTECDDLAVAEIPPRSRLYSLEPIGVGTPYVESMISYTARLAHAHFVSPKRLFGWGVTLLSGDRLTSAPEMDTRPGLRTARLHNGGRSLNIDDIVGRYWLTALEALTLRRGLKYITMLPLSEAISRVELHRPQRAWCSSCLQSWKENGKIIYEPLLWSFQAVEVCPVHKRKLVQICRHCNSNQRWLRGRAGVGFCNLCYGWLGHTDYKNNSGNEGYPQGQLDYLTWSAENVGVLIASPDVFCARWKRQSVRMIPECIDRTSRGSITAFSQFLGVNDGTVHAWIGGKFPPRISHILKMAYYLGVGLDRFLSGKIFQGRKQDTFQSMAAEARRRSKGLKVTRDIISNALKKALDENPPPNPGEVASALGYKNIQNLQRGFPELCEKIVTRYKLSPHAKDKTRGSNIRKHELETLFVALRQELDKDVPSALLTIAKALGYSSSYPLRVNFPDLCEAIKSKRAERRGEYLQKIRGELELVLKEDPPPGVKAVARHFIQSYHVAIRDYFPDLYREIKERRALYDAGAGRRVELALRSMLDEDPPPFIEEVAERVGLSKSTLYKRFPEIIHAITTRHSAHVMTLRARKKAAFKEEVLKIVTTLYDSGVKPSRKLVWSFRESFSIKNFTAFALAYKEVMKELDWPK